jgi:hypothetical protein
MDDRGNERDDSRGGLGLGGAQRGEIGGDHEPQRQSDDASGEGQQRNPGGSSRDSEKMR